MSGTDEAPASETAEAPKRGAMTFRRSGRPRLDPALARRQGDITRLAIDLLGGPAAIRFLNTDNSELGARPLDLAIASAEGRATVEAELARLATPATA